jgi:cellobionic acid phosphorylase
MSHSKNEGVCADRALLLGTDDGYCELRSATAMPRASAFLWNKRMMIQATCRGYAVAQHMQPEPAKYAHGPVLEAKTFMQPEQPYYAHHPGRFVYVKDEQTGALFSAPYEPVRAKHEAFVFSAGAAEIRWLLRSAGIVVELVLQLPVDDAVELWTLDVRNDSGRARSLSIAPFFTIGYMSWMNQSAAYDPVLGGVVASSVTPYQRLEDYAVVKTLKDKTFLLHDTPPVAWEAAREAFEGEGGLHDPDALRRTRLGCSEARYETPAAVLQYRVELADGERVRYRFLFGPARDNAEISALRDKYFADGAFEQTTREMADYLDRGRGVLEVSTPDATFDRFVNDWLPRQVYYHGDVNRLTTDPQTRNYLQDAMGMSYILPDTARRAFLHALSQQQVSGQMPDGILLYEGAELKYINRVPHSDHCVWLPVCLQAYLDETADFAILDAPVCSDDGATRDVFERITMAMRWLLAERDARGLNYIAQGDWCDPMNMVGHKGKGVSGWLSVATVYALRLWAAVADRRGEPDVAAQMRCGAQDIATAVQTHLWDGAWFARGITDDGAVFGVSADAEGRIFLNPQSWAMLAGIPSPQQRAQMIDAIDTQLNTPYGVMMFAPAYTSMREDIGRVTQKSPGTAENGAVYSHAAAFYLYSLYSLPQTPEADRAFQTLRAMIPGPDEADYLRRGQLPVFIPNYYRGAYYQFPSMAGRSSQLFNTGSASWVYRALIDGLFGVCGCAEGLRIAPQLPSSWQEARVRRRFRGAEFNIHYRRSESAEILVDGERIDGNVIANIVSGRRYDVVVSLSLTGMPMTQASE